MNKRHSAPDDLPGDRDDFELINGIGEGIAKGLYRSGIHRFSELALFTAQELAERIREVISIAPAQRIENDDWIGQARELARRKLILVKPKLLPRGQKELANFLVIFEEITDSEGKVKIQTVINHEQSNQSERWNEIATDALIQWMLAKADLPGQAPQETPAVIGERHVFLVPEDELEEEIELTLTDLWVSQAATAAQPSDLSFPKLVHVEGKLNIEGVDAHSLTYELVPFHIKVHLAALEGNLTSVVATFKGQLEPDTLNYTFQQDFPVPERGRYRLSLTARLLFPFTAEAEIQGPILRVGVP
jgi:hypothetical protein